MSVRIELDLDRSVTRLAGYEYGKSVFDNQVKDKIDYNDSIVIVFPSNIVKLASSFIQGFFGEMVENIGISGIEEKVSIESSNPKIHRDVVNNLI